MELMSLKEKMADLFNGSIMSNGMVENGQLSQKTEPKNTNT